MRYVDGYVLPVKKKELKTYKKMANYAGKSWRKCGALEYVEAVAEDVKKHPWMGMTFPGIAKCKPGEAVIFSYIVFKSRKHRDAVNKKVMKQMEKNAGKWKDKPMPFELKRMAYGGFKTLVDL